MMMGIIDRQLKQDVTFWASTGADGYGGWNFSTPVKIKGRWVEKQELFKDNDGQEVMSAAVAYLPQDVAIGDYLADGDHTVTLNPLTILTEAHRVRQYLKTTDLRMLQSVRKVFL